MKILFEHPEKVPVKDYGGTERILIWLMKELTLLGHNVYLIGHPESEVSNIGVTLIPKPRGIEDFRPFIPKEIDIVHLFSNPKYEIDKPLICTLHGNGQVGEKFFRNTVFLSKNHAANHNSEVFVYNGIDLDEYPFNEGKTIGWDNFLFLAKASWKVKNLNDCIKACKSLKKHLHVAGGKRINFSPFIHYYGLVNQQEKLKLLEKCDCLLWPVRWPEPFGVAVIEAMAMGLPVISSSYGSLPELVKPEVGILCNNFFEFKEAIKKKPKRFIPNSLRRYVQENFTSRIMAENYLKLYEKVLKNIWLNPEVPRYLSKEKPQKLLEF
jgi:glycosyltransferase involved in cell wall biosynthesis